MAPSGCSAFNKQDLGNVKGVEIAESSIFPLKCKIRKQNLCIIYGCPRIVLNYAIHITMKTCLMYSLVTS